MVSTPRSLEAPFTSNLDILGVGAKDRLSIRLALEARLGGQENIIAFALSLDPFSDNDLAVTVDISQAPEMKSGRVCVPHAGHLTAKSTSWSVESADAAKSKADGRDFGAMPA